MFAKAYMKALEDMSDNEQDLHIVSSLVNTLVNKTVVQIDPQDDDDDKIDLAERIRKGSLTTSTINLENDAQQIKQNYEAVQLMQMFLFKILFFFCSLYQFLFIITIMPD
ncbi:unnamed protein product [Rotaria sp. Silwood2]|nr:unnamed protein product [Rotaria sp. Silwood2]CAF4167056.1 unnamed protein product [Rotaria sp. Silwood2]CAF4239609.1 unnamed protein product [Rotaria sp. Silwood2]